MGILLKGRNIEHSYREGKIVTQVLKGVNLDIESSKMTAIVGKSGSGKSTLLHILGTLDTPDKGEIWFQDTDITKLTDRQKANFRNRHLGFIYQFHHLLDDFTVLENVMLPLLIPHTEKDLAKSRAHYLLERVGLSDRLKYLPSELSGGERQRVAIARAMVHSPELILADEPTGNLDEGNAATVFDLFKELARDEKTAVVMVTHDLGLARQCDEILEMAGGVVLSKNQLKAETAKFNAASEFTEASNFTAAFDNPAAIADDQSCLSQVLPKSSPCDDIESEQTTLTAYQHKHQEVLKQICNPETSNTPDLLADTSEVETLEEADGAVIFLQHDESNHALEDEATLTKSNLPKDSAAKVSAAN